MNDNEMRRLDTLKRVRSFGIAHDQLFPAGSLARELFHTIAVSVEELEGHAAAESSGRGTARQNTAGKAAARDAILEDLSIIRRTARSMSLTMTGMDEKFRIPRSLNDRELLDTARAFLADAEPLKTDFLRREVPEIVFQRLQSNIEAFEATLTGQHTGKEETAKAVAAIDAAIERASDALRQLDPIVRNRLRDDPAELAAWEGARRVERAPRRSNGNTPAAPKPPEQ